VAGLHQGHEVKDLNYFCRTETLSSFALWAVGGYWSFTLNNATKLDRFFGTGINEDVKTNSNVKNFQLALGLIILVVVLISFVLFIRRRPQVH